MTDEAPRAAAWLFWDAVALAAALLAAEDLAMLEYEDELDEARAEVARLTARVVELERFIEDPCPPVRTGPPKRAVCRPIVEIEYDGET